MNFLKQILFKFKKSIPISLKWRLRKIRYYGHKHFCNVCNSDISGFQAGGLNIPAIEKYEITGGGYHEYDHCPVCRASYRQRFVKLYMDENNILKPNLRILHIAPEECLFHILRRSTKEYVCGDLMPERYSYYANPISIDLTKIPFPENSFDLIFCSHILEHIPNDSLALHEIFRVLDQGGQALIQVPVSKKLERTYEDSSINTNEGRFEKFGQHDHVRIYAMDLAERINNAGFLVENIPVTSFSQVNIFEKLKLDLKEELFVARK
jgi:SAM-dependent methyltransferase